MSPFSWQDRVVLVTGSSSGIGASTARRFADAGAAIVINSATSVDAGEALARSLPTAVYVQADVSVPDQSVALVERAAAAFGRLDGLVNNAGTSRKIAHRDLGAVQLGDWMSVLDVNLLGTWEVTRAAVPALRASGGGSVVNVSSLAGVVVGGSSIPYAVSKAAVNHLTVLLAKALAPDIRVNAVAPGMTETPWTSEWVDEREKAARRSPGGRIATADEVADAIFSLASLTHTTGEILLVDGGAHL
ncbi:SDR family oxidoreductase [Micromonospora sp. NBC_00389]|uniref:SDR family NAD(P)-dependent oxidoreductase n=1 Tax=Micromonospora sp. NBC_00389 TaxID=2903586 RepID=UPI002E1C8086